jgi:hypothetical protein
MSGKMVPFAGIKRKEDTGVTEMYPCTLRTRRCPA